LSIAHNDSGNFVSQVKCLKLPYFNDIKALANAEQVQFHIMYFMIKLYINNLFIYIIMDLFLNRRVVVVLFLGFSSGLPLALSGGTLQAWLTVEEVDCVYPQF